MTSTGDTKPFSSRRAWSIVGLISLVAIAAGLVAAGAMVGVSRWPAFNNALHQANLLYLVPMCGLTMVSLFVRFLRWQFLLRRAAVRLPIRDSLFAYVGSLVGVATPAHVGELLRAGLLKQRFGAPVIRTVYAWGVERVLDAGALGLIGVAAAGALGNARHALVFALVFAVANVALLALRAYGLSVGIQSVSPDGVLTASAKALGLSVIAWLPPCAMLLLGVHAVGGSIGLTTAVESFAWSTLVGGLSLLPAGVLSTGPLLTATAHAAGLATPDALAAVTLTRMATVGLAFGLGVIALALLARGRKPAPVGDAHFDAIASEYRAQFANHVWQYLLEKKLRLITRHLPAPSASGVGLDLGCGVGNQCGVMNSKGFRVVGVDPSGGLLRKAREANIEVVQGSALELPFASGAFDYVYTIGVLHHVGKAETQRSALLEARRVLRDGGLLFIHETNPKNLLFRLYMGYLFPLVKSIDEGTENWIEPERVGTYEGFEVVDVSHFTFFPEFRPKPLMPLIAAIEDVLEKSPLRAYSAHYCATLRAVPQRATPEA